MNITVVWNFRLFIIGHKKPVMYVVGKTRLKSHRGRTAMLFQIDYKSNPLENKKYFFLRKGQDKLLFLCQDDYSMMKTEKWRPNFLALTTNTAEKTWNDRKNYINCWWQNGLVKFMSLLQFPDSLHFQWDYMYGE